MNKLVSVAPLAGRYSAQLGDVVVGRIADIAAQRWKLDICAQQDAILQLSAVNLPGSAQVKQPQDGFHDDGCCAQCADAEDVCVCSAGARLRMS